MPMTTEPITPEESVERYPPPPSRPHDLELTGAGAFGDGQAWAAPAGVQHVQMFEELDDPHPPHAWWSIRLWLMPGADRDAVEAEVLRWVEAGRPALRPPLDLRSA